MGLKSYTTSRIQESIRMSIDDFNGSDLRVWNRRYLNSFWLALVAAAIAEELYFLLSGTLSWSNHLRLMLLPGGICAGVLGTAELLYRRMPHGGPYWILASSVCICTVFVSVHHQVDYIQSLLMLPIFTAAFYYKRHLVMIASALCMAAFLLLSFFHPMLHARTSPEEWTSMLMIQLVVMLITLSVMERGIQLLKELRLEAKDKQHLMIQNVIKDKMVLTDPLTGLNNRAALYEHLDMLLRYADSEGFSLHVAMIDIDRFKSINDTFGHHVGDIILKRVAAAIREGVGLTDFAARYGGEEFAAVFTDRVLEEAYGTLEKIRRDVESMVHPETKGIRVTISVGLYPYGKGMDKEVLLEQADFCLYRAKRSGRNTVVFSNGQQ